MSRQRAPQRSVSRDARNALRTLSGREITDRYAEAERIQGNKFTVLHPVDEGEAAGDITAFRYEDVAERSRLIGLVQVSDFAEGTLATPERVPLGDGIIPLERILGAFEASDYDGYYEIEQLGPEIERLGYEESLRRSLAFLAK